MLGAASGNEQVDEEPKQVREDGQSRPLSLGVG